MPVWMLLGLASVGAYLLLSGGSASAAGGAPNPPPQPGGQPSAPPQQVPPYTLPADAPNLGTQSDSYATQAEAQAAAGTGTAVQLSDGRWYVMPYGGYD